MEILQKMGSSPSSKGKLPNVDSCLEVYPEKSKIASQQPDSSRENNSKEDKLEDYQNEEDAVSVGDNAGKNTGDQLNDKSCEKNKQDDEEPLEEVKLKLAKVVQYLEECDDYTTEKCFEHMDILFQVSKRQQVRKELGTYLTKDLGFAQLFLKVWHSLATDDIYDITTHKQPSKNLRKFKNCYWNFTDSSPELCSALNTHNALVLLFEELGNPLLDIESLKSESRRFHIKATMGILMNAIRLCGACRSVYRNANAVELISKYVKSTFLIIRAKSLLLLSYIVDEEESESLAATDGSVDFILTRIRDGLKTADHRAFGFTVTELLQGLIQLATHDKNKVKIGVFGGVAIICKALTASCSEEEQVLAAKALWSLAFADLNREIIKQYETGIKALKQRNTSEIPALKEACVGALWEVFGGNKTVYCTESKLSDVDASTSPSPSYTPHIMISYQWDVQKRVLELRERLIQGGYKVWMDVDKLEGDLLVAMADAVEKAAVIIVCISQKYKDSQNCRTEASYAYKQNKAIVPLVVEPNYVPDGWLGALVGMLKYFKLESNEQVAIQLPLLVQELGSRGTIGSRPVQAPAVVPVKAATLNASKPSVSQDAPNGPVSVNNWTSSDVEKWLDSKGLSSLQFALHQYGGRQLTQMYKHYQRAPDFFLSSLKEDLKMDYFTTLNFTAALEDLFS